MKFQKGHGLGEFKKMDANKFCEGYAKWCSREWNINQFAKHVGLSYPTLHKHLNTFLETGRLDVFYDDLVVKLDTTPPTESKYPKLGE